ncbi:carbonic anhydrase [Sphingomonas guangdongensis]|uniref:carbonic anhydrase n=1 Tax=Sphingomonas guangdongensis TaxID=1141890 RepID=A0A285R1J3_9SPHN|nr:carbonic anhydrase [Sphingomonas guangdongensis]SOB87638.1 carbonic anhydrase [Sphingomonas guangdongensis]
MRTYKQLLLANQAWATELTDERADFFAQQTAGQCPEFLWIGSSDSRVSPEQMTQTPPGDMLLHRNMANLVKHDDHNLMALIEHAVTTLKVRHIIVCGHYGCVGSTAAVTGTATGSMAAWLDTARQVYEDHREDIDAQDGQEARVNRFVEVNVRDQLVNLARTAPVQQAFAAGAELFLHGWVYDIRDGLIRPMMEIDAATPLDAVPRPERVLLTTEERIAAGDEVLVAATTR